jgi:hypothetical protein
MLEQKDSHDRLPRWNVGRSVVVHPKLSHKRFPMDGWCVGGCGVTLFAVGWFVLTPESQLAMVDDNYLSAVS